VSRRCQITNKGNHKGNTVSHANNRRRKTWNANIQTKRVFDSETGTWVKLRIATRTLRTISKKGLSATLKQAGLTLEDVRR
jgi:large subunit ribosomal protein L28